MTTAIYKWPHLIVESQSTVGNERVYGLCSKLVVANKWVAAISGSMHLKEVFRRQLDKYVDGSLDSDYLFSADDDFSAIIVLKDPYSGVFRCDSGHLPYEVDRAWATIGSGGPFASGAIKAGADPFVAMGIAIELDCFSGGFIEWFDFEKGKKFTKGQV